MTKEEIQAQLQLLEDLLPLIPIVYVFDLNLRVLKLRKDYEQVRSIQDLQREAFEASRAAKDPNYNGEPFIFRLRYETFEDYLKQIDNG